MFNPMTIMQILGFAAGVGEELAEDEDTKKRFAALKAGLGAGLTIGGAATKFAPASIEKIEGVGPLKDPKDYLKGLVGASADQTQQRFSSGSNWMDGWKGVPKNNHGNVSMEFGRNNASLFDPFKDPFDIG
jgi:hypothetical protein